MILGNDNGHCMLNPPGPQAGANGPFRRFSTDFSTGECMSGKTSIAVLGGGSWGTALAHLLAHAGHSVALLLRDTEQAAHINAHHENPRYLRGRTAASGHPAVAGDTGGPEQAEVLAGVSILVLSVPCQAMAGDASPVGGRCAPGLRSCQYGKRNRSFRAGYGGAHGPGRAARIRGPLCRPFRAVVCP